MEGSSQEARGVNRRLTGRAMPLPRNAKEREKSPTGALFSDGPYCAHCALCHRVRRPLNPRAGSPGAASYFSKRWRKKRINREEVRKPTLPAQQALGRLLVEFFDQLTHKDWHSCPMTVFQFTVPRSPCLARKPQLDFFSGRLRPTRRAHRYPCGLAPPAASAPGKPPGAEALLAMRSTKWSAVPSWYCACPTRARWPGPVEDWGGLGKVARQAVCPAPGTVRLRPVRRGLCMPASCPQ